MEASIFTRLSPEIRNIVWQYSLSSQYAITLRSNAILHPLTSTCRQIRDETLEMYLDLTSFNAHLDDGPATPLAQWLQTMGSAACLLLREVNIWDMHMLNGTLHGVETTQRMLRQGTLEGESYVLRPVGRQVFHRSWYLKDIILPLQTIGLGLARFCIVENGNRVKETSHFAIMPSSELRGVESAVALAEEFGLSEKERANVMAQLDSGRREIRLFEGRRNIILNFDSDQRLVSMRQEFIPRDEEFYL